MFKKSVSTRVGFSLGILVIIALAISFLSGCSEADEPVEEGLPHWISEDQIVSQMEEVVDDFNARDYEAISALFADESVTAEDLESSLSTVQDEYGSFVSYGDAVFLQGESRGRSYATVIQDAVYENGTAEFRISFFEDGSLAGFYFLKAA